MESAVKKLFSKIFRVKEWADWNRNLTIFEYLKAVALRLFVPRGRAQAKKFETVVKHYQLDDIALNQQAQALKYLSLLFIILALLMDTYAIYLLIQDRYFQALVVFCVSCIAYALGFRYHFFYTLIKFKRLDCSLKDWYQLNFKKA
jgi:intracellular multiplication protein IcmV